MEHNQGQLPPDEADIGGKSAQVVWNQRLQAINKEIKDSDETIERLKLQGAKLKEKVDELTAEVDKRRPVANQQSSGTENAKAKK